MVKKISGFVLVSLQPSTLRGSCSDIGSTVGGFSVRQDPFYGRTAHTKCGMYLLGLSLTAASPEIFLTIL
jgi:hypothetical protein